MIARPDTRTLIQRTEEAWSDTQLCRSLGLPTLTSLNPGEHWAHGSNTLCNPAQQIIKVLVFR